MKKLTLICFLFLPLLVFGQIQTIAPKGKYQTSFAIVVDKNTYSETKKSVDAYRDMLLNEGLGAYILIDASNDAMAIRDKLIEMYKGKPQLEGCVLIGDIPIPMIRNAQHLSSAFKMDQNMRWDRSSIPSDRFYDDFGLKFNFLNIDEKKPLLHYYELDANSAMRIQSNIYSARIKPIVRDGAKSTYEQINDYLNKVIAERNTANKVDNLMMFRGHGYNSEAMEAWSGEQITLREQLPELFKAGSKAKFLAYEMRWPMKFNLIEELQREDLDIALFHEHGSPSLQYINNYPQAKNAQENIESIKLYVRSKVEGGMRRGKTKDEMMDQYAKYLGIPREWCEVNDSTMVADSILNSKTDIHLEDLYNAKLNARFVMFDACYNGSFNNDEYIAGAYIFNPGKTIVTLGNSVNSLQDKFPNEFIGLLGKGVRVGLWVKDINYLESHIIGDPTFKFASTTTQDFNKSLVLNEKDNGYWINILKTEKGDLQAVALRKLFNNNYSDISKLLKETYLSSEYGAVRMEAVKLLSLLDNDDTIEVLKLSASDPYELVRRLTMEYIGKNGSPELIETVINSIVYDNISKRVMFKANSVLGFFEPVKTKEVLKSVFDKNTNLLNGESMYNQMMQSIDSRAKSIESSIKEMNDSSLKDKARITEIRSIRNSLIHYKLSEYISFASNEKESPVLREAMLEALSWYYLSYRKNEIISLCDTILKSNDSEQLKKQALKTKNMMLNKGTV